jgi:hypothetical protein
MRWVNWVMAAVVLATTGCATTGGSDCAEGATGADAPKTLLRWSAAKEEPKPAGEADEPVEAPEPDVIVTDRPDFTEASSTVGRGRIQLEAGYTYFRDRSGGITTYVHSYPEALFRIGMFAEWFELRVGQNFSSAGSPGVRDSGANDLYLGVKLGLTEQHRFLPETALILQTTVPTGADAFTSGKMLPGLNLLYGWDVIPDRISCGGSSQANAAIDDAGRSFTQLAQSLTVGYTITPKLGAYTECFAFFPHGATLGGGPEYYFDGGFTYKVTNNFQLDVRGGVGLNRNATDYFTGAGFAYRY